MAEHVIAAMKVCLALLAVLLAQSRPTFEVASIKRNASGSDAARVNAQAAAEHHSQRVGAAELPNRRRIRSVSGHMEMNAVPMANFARNLSSIAGRSIVDKTGLTGGFDADLTWTPDASLGAPQDGPPPANDGPSLFTAMQEQLGLKLDAQRGPVEVLVIDSVERPTED